MEALAPAGSITKFALKLETGGRTIPVGQPPKVAQERKFLGVPLTELAVRDGRLVPRLVSDCVKWLWQNGKTAGVFVVDAEAERVDGLIARVEKDQYETLYEEAGVDCALVTSVLKRFLRAAAPPDDGLFTNALCDTLCATPRPSPDECAALLLTQLPPANFGVVELLLPLLHELSLTPRCAMDANALAETLTPVLLRSTNDASADTAAAQAALRLLIAEWPAVLRALDAGRRTDSGADAAASGRAPDAAAAGDDLAKDFNSLFELLDSVGLMQHFELFKQLGVALEDFRGMPKEELLGLGMEEDEVQILLLAVARSPQKTARTGSGSGSHEMEPPWEGPGLDPKVASFLEKLGLASLRELFDQFEIDWTILDMSSAADLKELGLDEKTITAIMHGMGKDPKIGTDELMVQPIALTATGQLELKSSLAGVQPAQARLAPEMIVVRNEPEMTRMIFVVV